MLMYIFSLVVFFVAYGYYSLIYRPQKIMKEYQQAFEEKGYKVFITPFSFFGSAIRKQLSRDQQIHGDAYYHIKTVLPSYDVRIGNVLNKVVIALVKPQLLKEFFSPQKNYYYQKVSFVRENFARFLGYGIVFSEGQQWKKKRKIMNNIFNYAFIVNNIPKISRIVDEGLDIMEQQNKAENEEKVYNSDILEVFGNMFANVMLQCFFGAKSSNQKIKDVSIAKFVNNLNIDASKQGFSAISLLLGIRFLNLGVRKSDRDINERITLVKAFAKDMVRKRIKQIEDKPANKNYTDIVEALKMSNQMRDGYSQQNLVDQFLTFFNAGIDTTSHLTQMMIYYISLNSSIEKRLRQQVNSIIKSDQDITNENLKKLTYIDWIQYETTRYYGPGTGIIPKTVVQQHYLGGILFKKGINVNISSLAIHYNPKYYKDPLEFRPERWESQCSQNIPFTLVGFSGGPRNCIGKHLAHLESKIALVKIVRRYKSFEIPKKKFKIRNGLMAQAEQMKTKFTSF